MHCWRRNEFLSYEHLGTKVKEWRSMVLWFGETQNLEEWQTFHIFFWVFFWNECSAWKDQKEMVKCLPLAWRYSIQWNKGGIIGIKILFINNGQSSSIYLLCTSGNFLLLNISWIKGNLSWLLNYTLQKLLEKKFCVPVQ